MTYKVTLTKENAQRFVDEIMQGVQNEELVMSYHFDNSKKQFKINKIKTNSDFKIKSSIIKGTTQNHQSDQMDIEENTKQQDYFKDKQNFPPNIEKPKLIEKVQKLSSSTNQNTIKVSTQIKKYPRKTIIMKNSLKNLCKSFEKFVYDYLTEENAIDIVNKRAPKTIDLRVHLQRDNVNPDSLIYEIIHEMEHIFGGKSVNRNYNVQLINRICHKQSVKLVFLFWLQVLADYWIFNFSNITDRNIENYRKTIPDLKTAVQQNLNVRFQSKRKNQICLDQIPKKPECVIQPVKLSLVKKRRLRIKNYLGCQTGKKLQTSCQFDGSVKIKQVQFEYSFESSHAISQEKYEKQQQIFYCEL